MKTFALFIAFGLVMSTYTPAEPTAEQPPKPAVSDQLGKVIWSKLYNSDTSKEQIWISAHRPATGVVTVLHEYAYGIHWNSGTKVWATYDLAPGETIHLSAAVGSTTKLVITSTSTPNGPVKVTATEQ